MSADTLDQRLREAFHTDDDWIPDVSLAEVRAEARRTTARRRTALAAAAAVVLVGGAAAAVTRGGADDGAEPVRPAPSPSASEAPLAVEGSWVSVPLTEQRIRLVLGGAGLDAYADKVVAELRPGRRARLLLRIENGFLDLQIKRDGIEEFTGLEYADRATYAAGAGSLQLTSREAEGESRLGWEVTSARELTFTFRSTTEADIRGVPAEAHLRALYPAVPFTPST